MADVADNQLADAFFRWMIDSWHDLKDALLEQKLSAMQDISKRNPFPKNIAVIVVPNSVNMNNIDDYKNIVEMYFSASMNEKNIPYIGVMYQKYLKYKDKLPGLVACKYYPFTKNMPMIEKIDADEPVNVDLFRVHTILGHEQQSDAKSPGNMLVNLVVIFDPVLEKYFEKKEIWIPNALKKDIIGEFLINLVGEYNFLHRTATIRLLSANDETALMEHSKHPHELRTVYDELERMHYRDVQRCLCCGHADYQLSLMRCSACKSGLYCSKQCQKIHRPLHKINCHQQHS